MPCIEPSRGVGGLGVGGSARRPTRDVAAVGKSVSHTEESVTLDNGGFAALELNSRHLSVKNTFSKKNGTR